MPSANPIEASQNTMPDKSAAGLPNRIYITEIIQPRDPRNGQFDDAKRAELEGPLQRGTFKLVLREEIGPDPNIILSRFALATRKNDDGYEIYKARYVLGSHNNRGKRSVVHSATTMKQSSIRLMLALATIFGDDMWATDIYQYYLQ